MPKKIAFQLITAGEVDENGVVYTLEVLRGAVKNLNGMAISKEQEKIGKISKAYIKDGSLFIEAKIADMQKFKEFLKIKGEKH